MYAHRKRPQAMTVEEVRKQLPRVGDKLTRRMEMGHANGFSDRTDPRACVVTYVNPAHLWYEVEFASGLRQAYKLPHIE